MWIAIFRFTKTLTPGTAKSKLRKRRDRSEIESHESRTPVRLFVKGRTGAYEMSIKTVRKRGK